MNIVLASRRLVYNGYSLLNKPSSSTVSAKRFLCSAFSRKPVRTFRNDWHLTNKSRKLLFTQIVRCISSKEKRAPAKVRNVRWKDLRAIFALAYPFRRRIYGMLFLIIGTGFGLLLPRIIFMFIDINEEGELRTSATQNSDKDKYLLAAATYLKAHPVILCALFCMVSICYGLRHYCMHTAGQLVINNLRREVFNSVIRQDMNFFSKNKVGELVSRLSTDALIVGQSVTANLTVGARAFMSFFGAAGIMVYTSPELSKVVTALTVAIVSSGYCFGNLQRKYTLQMQEAVAASNEVATEKFSNIVTVRTLVSEIRESLTYKDKIEELWYVARREGRAAGFMIALHEVSILASLYTIVHYGAQLMETGTLSYGDLLAFIWYASLCALSLPGMVNFYTDLMKGLGASARLFELRDRVPMVPITGGVLKTGLTDGIVFDNVSFAYPGRPLLFTNISFKIPAGKVTALVGPSGSGKSTVAYLVLRLQEPTTGRIWIDDINLKSIDPSHWRRQIGTVGQEPVLFSTTIRDNIVYGADKPDEITDRQLQTAVVQSNACYFINNLPEKFDTLVGEHGTSMLSGGQRQRIAIARALITNPMMLILDEATSALDATSEDLVKRAINELLENSRKTVLIIAHRLSTIKHADQIVVINNGEVVETGTFGELMLIKGGVFKELIEKQAIGLS